MALMFFLTAAVVWEYVYIWYAPLEVLSIKI